MGAHTVVHPHSIVNGETVQTELVQEHLARIGAVAAGRFSTTSAIVG